LFNFKKQLLEIQTINGIRDSIIPFLVSYLSQNNNIFYIAKSDLELFQINEFIIENFDNVDVYPIPAWDCLPFDVSSPNFNIISERVKTFTNISVDYGTRNKKNVFLTTINALFIKTAPIDFYKINSISISQKKKTSFNHIRDFFNQYWLYKSSNRKRIS